MDGFTTRPGGARRPGRGRSAPPARLQAARGARPRSARAPVRPRSARHRPILVRIHDPVLPHPVTRVRIQLDPAVTVRGGRRQDLDDEVRCASHLLLADDLPPLVGHEDELRLNPVPDAREFDEERGVEHLAVARILQEPHQRRPQPLRGPSSNPPPSPTPPTPTPCPRPTSTPCCGPRAGPPFPPTWVSTAKAARSATDPWQAPSTGRPRKRIVPRTSVTHFSGAREPCPLAR